MALTIRIGAVPGVLTTLEMDDGALVADAFTRSGRTLGARQHIEIIGAEDPVALDDALIDDKTYVIVGSNAAVEVLVSVGEGPGRITELAADATTVAHALHAAGVSYEGRSLTVDGRPAVDTDILAEGQHVRVGPDHLIVHVEIGGFRGRVALTLGSTPIDAILAAGIDAEIPGFAVRLQGGTEFEAIEPDAALAHGCVLRTAEPAPAETQADPVDQLVALLDGTLNRLEAGVAEAEAAPEVFESATQTIYGLVEDGGDGSTSIRWFRDKAVADMLMDDSSENWDAAFGTNDGPEILVFPAGLNLEACGFSFSDHAHPLPI